MRTTIVGLSATLVCAVIGSVFAWWLASPAPVPEIGPTERAVAAADGLRNSNVYVEPAARDFLNERQIARLNDAAAASDPEVFVVVWHNSLEAGYAIPSDVLGQIGARLDRPGIYLELDPVGGLSDTEVGVDGSFSFFAEDAENWSGQQATDDVLRLIQENDGGSYETVAITDRPASSYWGGTGGAIGAGLFLGTLGALGGGLIGIIAWFTVRARRIAAGGVPPERTRSAKALSDRARRRRAASRNASRKASRNASERKGKQ